MKITPQDFIDMNKEFEEVMNAVSKTKEKKMNQSTLTHKKDRDANNSLLQ